MFLESAWLFRANFAAEARVYGAVHLFETLFGNSAAVLLSIVGGNQDVPVRLCYVPVRRKCGKTKSPRINRNSRHPLELDARSSGGQVEETPYGGHKWQQCFGCLWKTAMPRARDDLCTCVIPQREKTSADVNHASM